MTREFPGGTERFYIGSDDCKKASCPRKQEFPRADDPYCIGHSWAEWVERSGGEP